MSIHSSLRGIDTLKGDRSVLTRLERLQILRKEGRFDDNTDQGVYGLPKVRTKFKVASGKAKKAEKAAAKDEKKEAKKGAKAK